MLSGNLVYNNYSEIGTEMKETEILALLDKALVNISSRELVATSEMTDLLLDIRLHLMLAEESSDIKAK